MTKIHLAPPPVEKPSPKSDWRRLTAFVFVVSFAVALAWLL
jgi:hypothetical protein